MKLKYYMRGVGSGILFTLFVFVVIIIPNLKLENRINEATASQSDTEGVASGLVGRIGGDDEDKPDSSITAIPKATAEPDTDNQNEAAGSLEVSNVPDSPEIQDKATDAETTGIEQNQGESQTAETSEENGGPKTTDSPEKTPTPTATATPTPKPTATATPTPKPTATATPTPKVDIDEEAGTVKFTISRGMTSEKISKALEEYGVVDSATGLNSYISKNGYAAKIQVGTFTFTKGMSYRDVCKVICGKNFK